MSVWDSLLASLKLKARYLFSLALAAGVLWYLDPYPPGRPLAVVVTVVASVFAIVRAADWAEQRWNERVQRERTVAERRAERGRIMEAVRTSSAPEVEILHSRLKDGNRTAHLSIGSSHGVALAHKGLIEVVSLSPGEVQRFTRPYVIPEHVWSVLLEMKDEIEMLHADKTKKGAP